MRNFLFALLLVVYTFRIGIKAQDKPFMEDLYYYLENTEVYEVGQEDGRAFHIPEPANL